MLEVTYLGHQGWMFGAGGTFLLVDPILHDSFGVRPDAALSVFPQRHISVERAPAIDAVFFSHEHDDHFQIASLTRLSRRTLVVLSSRSSVAARRIAADLGFQVKVMDADESLSMNNLELRTFAPDFMNYPCQDEWDVLPFSVTGSLRNETFLSTVDLPPETCSNTRFPGLSAPVLSTRANNFSSKHCLTSWMPAPPPHLASAPDLVHTLAQAITEWPATTFLLSGGGWSFTRELQALNHSFFPIANDELAKSMFSPNSDSSTNLRAPLPGDTFEVHDGKVAGLDNRHHGFIRPAPPTSWADRTYDVNAERVTDVAPLLGKDPLDPRERQVLRDHLQLVARRLLGGRLFRALASLTKEELGGTKRAYLLFAQTDDSGSGMAFEYSAHEGAFRETDSPIDHYAAGAACWARDLLAVLTGQISGPLFTMGRLIEWVNCPAHRPDALSIRSMLWVWGHPLQMPDEFFQLYRSLSHRFKEFPMLSGPS